MTGRSALFAVLAAAAAAGYYAYRRSPAPAPGLSSASAPAVKPSGLPSLEESDELVREKAFSLSTDIGVRSWLSSDSLIARFVGGMHRIANGEVPRESLGVFAPRGAFPLKRRQGRAYADPAGGARYAAFVAAVDSIDAPAAAALFIEFEPLLDAAYAELGEKSGSARAAFHAAAAELLATPAVPETAELKPGKKGIVWIYADPKLEALSPAQKQLLRLGPRGRKAVQDKLSAIAAALEKP